MAQEDGRGALIGEFLQSFFSAPKDVQDEVIFNAVNRFGLFKGQLIDPYPVLSYLFELLQKSQKS